MSTLPVIRVDLSLPPEERWQLTPEQCDDARRLLSYYVRDLGALSEVAGLLETNAEQWIAERHVDELRGLASRLGLPLGLTVLGNLYYDAIKFVIGCSAFAVDSAEGPIHARNLDWWTSSGDLTKTSVHVEFVGAPAGDFHAVGWPGLAGVFSGLAPGRFAITLNRCSATTPPGSGRRARS